MHPVQEHTNTLGIDNSMQRLTKTYIYFQLAFVSSNRSPVCLYVSRDASVRKRNLRTWRTPRDEFGFMDWNIYFRKGCNYSNDTIEMM